MSRAVGSSSTTSAFIFLLMAMTRSRERPWRPSWTESLRVSATNFISELCRFSRNGRASVPAEPAHGRHGRAPLLLKLQPRTLAQPKPNKQADENKVTLSPEQL